VEVTTQPGENTDKLSTTFDPDTYVEVRMNGLPASAKWRMVSIPADDTDPPKAGSDDWYSFATDDKDIAPRLVKALNHAIELCHAALNLSLFRDQVKSRPEQDAVVKHRGSSKVSTFTLLRSPPCAPGVPSLCEAQKGSVFPFEWQSLIA